MKNIYLYLLIVIIAGLSACKKPDYINGTLSPIIAVSDLRALYKGSDIPLTTENISGADQIVGIVISDAASGNAPAGVVVLQNFRRNFLRGINLVVGADASNYMPGDSLVVDVTGGTLTRVNGSLQIVGLSAQSIIKVASNKPQQVQSVSSTALLASPDAYESTLIIVGGGSFSPKPAVGETYLGDKVLVNGTNRFTLHTEATANYATELLPLSADVTGIPFRVGATGAEVIQLWPRTFADIKDVSDPGEQDPETARGRVIITGFANDVKGSDANAEYVQLMATTDVDFSKTPFSVVVCTNAGTNTPNVGAAPGAGWATGGGRTYKFNLRTGIVRKGEFFYVGGSNRRINGPGSTDISSAKWIRFITYGNDPGDGIGDKSGGLLPNSGNAGGIALFAGTTVMEATTPIDVVFYGGTGKTTIVNENAGLGYRVANNDHYKTLDPTTLIPQPFFYQGTNTYVIKHVDPADQGVFMKLGGVFNAAERKWETSRGISVYLMAATTAISEIQTGSDVTKLTN